MGQRRIELSVGLFVAAAIAALLMLAFKVANQGISGNGETYVLYAKFDNIGGLKERSPIKVGGVVVGRVGGISLDQEDFTPLVSMSISTNYNQFPETTSVSIVTSGLLGEQYISLQPGFMMEDVEILGPEDFIEDTKSALVLEDLIGQFLFSQSED